MVVAVDGRTHRVLAEHRAAAGAEVRRGAERRVVDVVGRLHPVAVPVAATADQLEGMNCIGPTARSQTVSLSQRPSSVSRIAATGPTPLRGTPMMSGCETPSATEHRAVVTTVVGLDPADPGQEGPRQLAPGIARGHRRGRVHVGALRRGGQSVVGERAGRPGDGALRAAHLHRAFLAVPAPAAAANHASTGPSSAATVGLTLGGAASAASAGARPGQLREHPLGGVERQRQGQHHRQRTAARPRRRRDTGHRASGRPVSRRGVRRSGTLPRLGADVAREFRMLKISQIGNDPQTWHLRRGSRTGGRGTGSSAGRAAARDSPAASRASQPVMVLGLLAGSHLTRPRRTHSSDHLLSRVHTP